MRQKDRQGQIHRSDHRGLRRPRRLGTGSDVAVDAIATYRLVRLLQQDTITEKPRNWIMKQPVIARHPELATLLDCPWCLSVWIGFGVAILRRTAPRLWGIAGPALASSALAGVITQAVDKLEND